MTRYVIIGAGIHGLSTAWHLAKRLRASGRGGGADVLVLDKSTIGAGASGVACGIVRNNYFQPAMRELMAHSVAVWESDPEAFSYHPVGYLQVAPPVMAEDVAAIHASQREIGYESVLVDGVVATRAYLTDLFADWQATGASVVLHEKRGGYANNLAAVRGLAAKARALGVEIRTGVRVRGVRVDAGAVTAVDTDSGRVECDQLVIAAGPWVRDLWAMLELPDRVSVAGVDTPMWTYLALQEGTLAVPPGELTDNAGKPPPVVHVDSGRVECDQLVIAAGPWVRDLWAMLELPDRVSVAGVDTPMWTYLALREGTLAVPPGELTDNAGKPPPVVHVDSDAPLLDDMDGGVITDELWGVYYKPDFHFDGVQGGAAPVPVSRPAEQVAIDPYGPASPEFVVGDSFVRMWTSALAHCHKRFEGRRHLYRRIPSGGIGAFTPDSFPVFDLFRQNAYVIADANHGFKMIGVGDLVAAELLGEPQALLEPFRFDRYATGHVHPVSHSPFPWS